MSTIYTLSPLVRPYNRQEILRYSGTRQATEDITALLDGCLAEVDGRIHHRLCYRTFKVTPCAGGLDMGFAQTSSSLLKKQLAGCDTVLVFAATIGLDIDRLITKYSRVSPARALMFQAIGTERIEALCDTFEQHCRATYATQKRHLTRRVSPGYGDIPLSLQQDLFAVLDCPRKIGLSLNDSLLMSPTKSVTAILGVGYTPCAPTAGCDRCDQPDCPFRRTL